MNKLFFMLPLLFSLATSCNEKKVNQNKFVRVDCKVEAGRALLIKDGMERLLALNFELEPNYKVLSTHFDSISFIAISAKGDVMFDYMGLFDKNGDKIYSSLDSDSPRILANPKYLTHSINNEYYLIEGGTAASIRSLQIINRKGLVVDRFSYVASLPEEGLNWNEKDELIYFKIADEKCAGENCKAEKYIWKDGKSIKTKETQEIYIE